MLQDMQEDAFPSSTGVSLAHTVSPADAALPLPALHLSNLSTISMLVLSSPASFRLGEEERSLSSAVMALHP